MNKAVFLDRDGTINVDYGYVHEKEKFDFIPGAIEGLKMLQELGYLLIIITNQSGIERGYYDEKDLWELNRHMCKCLEEQNIQIDDIYYCKHWKTECECRKPKTELFYRAQKEHSIQFEGSYAIGDNLRDLAICEKEAVTGILLGKEECPYVKVENLLDAAKYIRDNR